MTRILFLILTLLAPLSAWGQEDKSVLAGFLEEKLSSAGRQITIEGFRGALSSRATVDRLVIADDEGPWLTLVDAVLDWNRSALLRGRVEVTELSAAEILLPRMPRTQPSGPSPEATPFELPELPVSVNIDSIRAERVVIGQEVLGEEAVVKVAGQVSLSGGDGTANLEIERTDGKLGRFNVDAGYSNETGELALDVTLTEGPDGIVANLAQLPGRPALSLTIQGQDPLDAFTARIGLASDGEDRVTGSVQLSSLPDPDGASDETGAVAQVRVVTADLSGDIAPLFAPEYRAFFGPDIALKLSARQYEDGRLVVEDLSLAAAALRLNGDLALAADGLPDRFKLDLRIANAEGGSVLLPLGTETRLRGADLQARFDAADGDRWTLRGTLDGLFRPDLGIERIAIDGGGLIQRGAVKQVSASFDANLTGLMPNDPALARALGENARLRSALTWREGAPIDVSQLELTTQGMELLAKGSVDGFDSGFKMQGEARADILDLERLSGLARRPLAGTITATMEGSAELLSGAFDLTLDATGTDLALGIDQVDPLLAGESVLRLSALRDTSGTTIRGFRIRTTALEATAEGTLASVNSDLRFSASLDDVGRLYDAVTGPVVATGTAGQTGTTWNIAAEVEAPGNALLQVQANLPEGGPSTARVEATVERLETYVPGVPALAGTARISADARQDAEDWVVNFTSALPGDIAATGQITLPPGARPRGRFEATVPQVEAFVPQLVGPATIRAEAQPGEDGLEITFTADAPEGITATGSALLPDEGFASAQFDARIPQVAIFVPQLDGPATLRADLTQDAAGISVDFTAEAPRDIGATGQARFPVEGPATAEFTARIADLAPFAPPLEGPATLSARASRTPGGWQVEFDADAPRGISAGGTATLDAEAPGPRIEGQARISDLSPFVAQLPGPARVDFTAQQSSIGWQVDFTADAPQTITAEGTLTLPPAGGPRARVIARVGALQRFVPPLAGPATITAEARQDGDNWAITAVAEGPAALRANADVLIMPGGDIDLQADARLGAMQQIVPQLRGAATATAAAQLRDGTWRVNFDAAAPAAITASGTVILPSGAGPRVDVDARIGALGQLVPGLDGVATLRAQARQEGEIWLLDASARGPAGLRADASIRMPQGGEPEARIDARIDSIARIVPGLAGSVAVEGTARRQGSNWIIDMTSSGPGAARLAVRGRVAADAATAALDLTGSAPLALANRALSPRSLAGTAQFDLRLNGPLALSSLAGQIRTSDARLSLPTLRNALSGINATVALSGGRAQVQGSGRIDSGGRFSVEGPIGLTPPFEAGLTLRLAAVELRDPELYETTLSGELRVTGALLQDGRISGRLSLGETELRVPSTGLGATGPIPPLEHLHEPQDVRTTRARAGLLDEGGSGAGGGAADGAAGPALALDVTIAADNRIFVRGRGLDAELGGSLRLGGTTRDVVPSGQFELVRGRLDILSQRLTLDEGTISLQGDFVPTVRLVARTETGDVAVFIVVEGRVNAPEIQFLSEPDLPEDEVLSRLLFGRAVTSLSPLQAAQLASAVATLAGRGGDGIVGRLREQTGLDDLDITTGEDGNPAVRAGKYLSDNVYTDVTVGSSGNAQINLNLDVSPSVTVKGRVGSDGETGLGVFFEKDY